MERYRAEPGRSWAAGLAARVIREGRGCDALIAQTHTVADAKLIASALNDHRGAVDLLRQIATIDKRGSHVTSNTEAAMRRMARGWLDSHDLLGGQ
jgi:hypothetical protein